MKDFDEGLALKILDSREKRSIKQKELIKKYDSTLISYVLNSPGIYKNLDIYQGIFQVGYEEILARLKESKFPIIYSEREKKETGPEGYILVDADAKKVKALMCEIENNHKLGRVFDIDIFDRDLNQLSRTDLGLEKRVCLVCDDEARICIRARRHSYEDLVEKIEDDWLDYCSGVK